MAEIKFTADGRYCEVLLSDGDKLHVVEFVTGEPVLHQGILHENLPIGEYHKDIEKLRSKRHQLKIECKQLEQERDRLRGEINMAKAVKEHG